MTRRASAERPSILARVEGRNFLEDATGIRSPVIFHLRLGDGLSPKVIEHEPAPEALGAPLVAISVQDDAE